MEIVDDFYEDNEEPGKFIAALYYWSMERDCLQWVGEMEMRNYEHPDMLKTYYRVKEWMKGYNTAEMLKGQAFGL